LWKGAALAVRDATDQEPVYEMEESSNTWGQQGCLTKTSFLLVLQKLNALRYRTKRIARIKSNDDSQFFGPSFIFYDSFPSNNAS
jgi:hypothetical protein